MVSWIGSFCSDTLIVEANDVFDGFYGCVFKSGEVAVHEVVAFYFVHGEFRDFWFAVFPRSCQHLVYCKIAGSFYQSQPPSGAIRSSAQGISTNMISAPAFWISCRIFSAIRFCCFGTSSQKRLFGTPNLAPNKAFLVVRWST